MVKGINILVLGSAGLIGKVLVKYLRDSNYFVDEFDIADCIEQDLRIRQNNILLEKIMHADFIYFLAFDVGGFKYLTEKQNNYDYIENNIKIMQNTFEVINQYKKPFIFASTQLVEEKDSTYGILKKIGEKYTFALDGLVVRLWNVYGLEEQSIKSHVIPDLIHKALYNKHINLISDGTEERQFLSVDECARCLCILYEKYDIIDRTTDYHITSFEWTKIADLANEISRLCDNVPIIYGNIKGYVKCEPKDYIKKYWQPKISLWDDLQKYILFYREKK